MTTGSSATLGLPDIGDFEVVERLVNDFEDFKYRFTDKLDQIVNLIEDL